MTYASPRLLRFCAVVWHQAIKRDDRSSPRSIFPTVFSGDPTIFRASPPSELKEKIKHGIKPHSFLACKSSVHVKGYKADDTHPHSLEMFGHPVCKMCFSRLFGLGSCRLLNIQSHIVLSTFNREFRLDSIDYWRKAPLMYILRGMAIYWSVFRNGGVSLADYEAIGRRISFDPLLDWHMALRGRKDHSGSIPAGEMFPPVLNYRLTTFIWRRGRKAPPTPYSPDVYASLDFFGVAYGVDDRMKLSIESHSVADGIHPYVSFTTAPGRRIIAMRAMLLCIEMIQSRKASIELHPLAPRCSASAVCIEPFSTVSNRDAPIHVCHSELITWPYLE